MGNAPRQDVLKGMIGRSTDANEIFHGKWIENAKRNISMIRADKNKNKGILALIGRMAGFSAKPIILVAGGPSLEDNLDALRKIKETTVIVADRMMPRVEGCKVDYVIVGDAFAKPIKTWKPRPKLIAGLTAPPDVVEPFSKKYWYIPTSHEEREKRIKPQHGSDKEMVPAGMTKMLLKMAGLPEMATGGNISTAMFTVALLMLTNRVVFVGHDFGFAEGVKDDHDKGKIEYKHFTGRRADDSKCEYWTRRDYYIYRLWTEQAIIEMKGLIAGPDGFLVKNPKQYARPVSFYNTNSCGFFCRDRHGTEFPFVYRKSLQTLLDEGTVK